MKVKLSSCGNPDLGQAPGRPLYGVRSKTGTVKNLAEASRVCLEYIAANQLGGGNWNGGQVSDDSGVVVAQVSYNGTVWPPGDWTPESRPLLK
jgi:hypothetical protein